MKLFKQKTDKNNKKIIKVKNAAKKEVVNPVRKGHVKTATKSKKQAAAKSIVQKTSKPVVQKAAKLLAPTPSGPFVKRKVQTAEGWKRERDKRYSY